MANLAALYIYLSLALQTIAKKTGTEHSWLAWVSIADIILELDIAKKPRWWVVLRLLPPVNLIFKVLVWIAIAEARSKPPWWGVLVIIPLANLIVPYELAWAD